jgi:hypothetical protein
MALPRDLSCNFPEREKAYQKKSLIFQKNLEKEARTL